MSQSSGLLKLASLAKETSSERRRELLRDITDLYFDNQNTCSEVENEHFGEILSQVTTDMDAEIRKDMAERFAKQKAAPLQLLQQLANDEIDIAGPVLRHSPILQDKHLTDVINTKSQEHMRAISGRQDLSTEVTSSLVQKGDDETLLKLARNDGAQFDRTSMESMVNRSETVTELQAPLVERHDMPADLMNDMYLFAEQKVRARILERNEEIDPEVLQQALTQARKQASGKSDPMPEGFHTAKHQISSQLAQGNLDGTHLLKFERDQDRLKFTLGLAALAKIDYQITDRILRRSDMDALALICRAIGFDSSLFVTIALLLSTDPNTNTGDSGPIREMYSAIPVTAAQRTLRFWQMRQKMENQKAA